MFPPAGAGRSASSADAEQDNGPDMETHYEDVHRCSRFGHADCGDHLRRQRGARIAGKLLLRGQRLLRVKAADSVLPPPRREPRDANSAITHVFDALWRRGVPCAGEGVGRGQPRCLGKIQNDSGLPQGL